MIRFVLRFACFFAVFYGINMPLYANNNGVISVLSGSVTSGSTDGPVTGTKPYGDFGPTVYPLFYGPTAVAVDSTGNVFVADTWNDLIRKVTPDGTVTTLAGSAGVTGTSDGTGKSADFDHPWGITVDGSGNVYVADTFNYLIRKINPNGSVTTLAGSGHRGFADGTGKDASFDNPNGIAVDSTGNIYVADTDNDVIRKINPSGIVSTFCGSAGVTGINDGPLSQARFYGPTGLAFDGSGILFVADTKNQVIRKIDTKGIVSTIAGSGTFGFADGQGSAALFKNPSALTVDSSGIIYVADTSNNRIREISPGGLVTTLVGIKHVVTSNGPWDYPLIASPQGIAVDKNGVLYVPGFYDNMIYKIQ